MIHITGQQLSSLLDYPSLVQSLHSAFRSDWVVPQRHHHDFENPVAGTESTLLLMPAWAAGKYLGVKTILVAPENSRYQIPAINGIYTLFDADKGTPLAQMDAPLLTSLRTAAASALASSFLSRKDSSTMLMVGTGSLAPELIKAHATVRPIEKVLVWGRNFSKAQNVAQRFSNSPYDVQPVEKIEPAIPQVDIISCATLSKEPLVFGKHLRPGQHLDLVGSFKPDMREVDDEVIRQSSIFADTKTGACKESGDLVIPLAKNIINSKDIKADLFDLCSNKAEGRISREEITLFKSVGIALEDLAAAILVWEKMPKLKI